MRRLIRIGAALCAATIALAESALAQIGTYRGPEGVVPPNGGEGSRRPALGTPGPPGVPAADPGSDQEPGSTTGSIDSDDYLTNWELWWELNKDPFLSLRDAIRDCEVSSSVDGSHFTAALTWPSHVSLKPTHRELLGIVVPSLHRALESTDQRDLVCSCMVALAKVGLNTDDINVLAAIRKRLKSSDQETRETAAIALGITQMIDAAPDLIELATDSEFGRALCERDSVDYRTRSFAIHGLGLLAASTADHAHKARIGRTLAKLLGSVKSAERDVKVSTILAMGSLRPDTKTEAGRELLGASLDALDRFWLTIPETDLAVVHAHVPTTIAKLFCGMERDSTSELTVRLDKYRMRWMSMLQGAMQGEPIANLMLQSAAIALGKTTTPADHSTKLPRLDCAVANTLAEYVARGRNQPARTFALMALGQIGGVFSRNVLLDSLSKRESATERAWAALALGVMAFRERGSESADVPRDTVLGKALVEQLNGKNPSTLGAVAIALGLAGFTEAAPKLRELLERDKNKDELAGYQCIGLALMGDQGSLGQIQDLVSASTRRAERLRQSAIALGKLGDQRACLQLSGLFGEDAEPNPAKMAAITSALGHIGDVRSIDPIVKSLFDSRLTDLTRASAAVALGEISAQRSLRWNCPIGVDMNYRAAIETLTNQSTGILDNF